MTALITKDVDAVTVPIDNIPTGAAPVAPIDCRVSIIIEDAVTAVVDTVAVPLTKVTVPKELAPAVVVLATLVEMILLPAVPRTKLPLVAVMAPNVAVMLVAALTAPAEATIFPVVAVIPVPAVIVVPAFTAPADATILPVVDVIPVPAVTVVAADIEPRVEVIFPVEATMLPVVAVIPVPAVTVVPAASVVVVVNEPGAVIAAGNDNVTAAAAATVDIWFAVPAICIFPATGVAVPELPVSVATADVLPPSVAHTPPPAYPKTARDIIFTQVRPTLYGAPSELITSALVGSLVEETGSGLLGVWPAVE